MAYTLTNAEREMTIRWDAEERIAHIYTSAAPYIRKLDKLCDEFPDEYKLVSRDEYGVKYTCPAERIRFSKPASEARKEAGRRNAAYFLKNAVNIRDSSDCNDLDVCFY